MALIKCPECGKEVSDKAVSCPDCGYPINQVPAQDTGETATSIDSIINGLVELPLGSSALEVAAASADASSVQATEVEIELAAATIEEGEKRKLDNISVSLGWDPETNFPKLTFNLQRTPTKKIVKWIKGKGRR